MNDKEYENFKELKEILLNHLSFNGFSKPVILVIDNENVKNRIEEVFKYDIQELSKYVDEELFMMKNPKLKVFKICTSSKYEVLTEAVKNNSIKKQICISLWESIY